jgi:hypothetical protein
LHDKRVIILIKDLKTSATSPGHEKQVQEAHIIDLKQIGVARVGLDDAGSGPAATVRVQIVVKTRSKVKNA